MSDITKDWSFGGQLRTLRVGRGFTLRDYSELIGLHAGNLSKLETSKLAPPKSSKHLRLLVSPLELNDTEMWLLVSAAFNFHIGVLREQFADEL